ncbi:hypothetical protein BW41_03268 [Sphingomonas sp. RIT328]|nr:hypothetical protein BW41_03268 [Sphingomonas sp. RIT328]
MDEVDLTGVFPSRREEIRRRVGLIRRYLEIARPSLDDDRRLADELGLSIQGSLRLVAAWRQHGRAAALPGARHAFRLPHRLNPSIDPVVETTIDEAIDSMGLQVRPADLVRAVADRCEEIGRPRPADQTIAARLMRRRHEEIPMAGDTPTSLVLDHTAVSLPVLDDAGRRRLPILTFAALMPSGFVVGHELTMQRPNPQVTASVLFQALEAEGGARVRLEMAADATPGWLHLLGVLATAGVERIGRSAAPVPSIGAARVVFGDAISEVRIRPRHTHRPASIGKTVREGRMQPFVLGDARSAMEDAIAVHNGLRTPAPFHVVEGGKLPLLLKSLTALAQMPPERPRHRRPTEFV